MNHERDPDIDISHHQPQSESFIIIILKTSFMPVKSGGNSFVWFSGLVKVLTSHFRRFEIWVMSLTALSKKPSCDLVVCEMLKMRSPKAFSTKINYIKTIKGRKYLKQVIFL